ncbi:MFS transporter [Paenibacillus lutrae]|uniref:MFS transporter n=1 Tax=Paenibacillus lutrae TaxID=2078573 RepID=A0A7X3FH61_9BACL|nr:MFS transporter [Paenibacillus lutrae]MVO99674.1 MFS transporter [Paenibacillus lutrae]
MNRKLIILLGMILAAGISQGMILPLLSLLLEQQGVSALANNMQAAVLYIGAISVVFAGERLIGKYGYKPLIVAGFIMVAGSTLTFTLGYMPVLWLLLRFLIGAGDSLIHYSTQTWMTAISPPDKRGRYLSWYGLMYGAGFAIGPLFINLLEWGQWVPFAVTGVLLALIGSTLIFVANERPPVRDRKGAHAVKYPAVYMMIWLPLLGPMLYGMMEAALNVSFPIYAADKGISVGWISIILPCFVAGSLLFNVPIGMLSDKIGPKNIMMVCSILGGFTFIAIPYFAVNEISLLIFIACAGIFVGSFFSLGLAYIAGVLPLTLLPAGNVLASLHFDGGSLAGPALSGLLMEFVSGDALFLLLGGSLLLFAVASFFYRRPGQNDLGTNK